MSILNIGIGNVSNIYIDNLKENNSKIKNYYVTYNKESYKYSNPINSFNYTSKVSLDFLLENLVDYDNYDIYFIYYQLDDDKEIIAPLVEFLHRTNKRTNLFPIDNDSKHTPDELRHIIKNYNDISTFLEEKKIYNVSFITQEINTESLYQIDTKYLTDNDGYLLLTHATEKEELINSRFTPTSLDCDLICTNFNYEYLNEISTSAINIIAEDITIFFGMDLPFEEIQEYHMKLLDLQSHKRKKFCKKIDIEEEAVTKTSVSREELDNIISDIMNQIM